MVQLIEKITYDANSTSRFKIIKRHETELKWIKLLQTPHPLGFNDNICHEGNLSKMPDFDVFSLLEFRKRTARSHGIKKNGNCKRKSRVQKFANCTLRDLAVHGRHCMLSYLSSLPISVLRSLDTEANKFYDRTNRLYDAALFTRCYTQHALRPVIDSKINHIRHFIKIPFINKGMDFPGCLRLGLSWFNWLVSFAPESQCCYFCEPSCLFYLSFNFDLYVSKIMHL